MSKLSLKKDFKDGTVLYGKQLNTCNEATEAAVNDNYEKIMNLNNLKANVSDVTAKLATKVDVSTFNDSINSLNATKANLSLVNTKADKSEVALKADKTELQEGLALKANTAYVNSKLALKADTDYVDEMLDTKADKVNIGELSDLKTDDKSSIVNAINSTQTKAIPIATITTNGISRPDGETITIDADGTLHSSGNEVVVGSEEPTDPNVDIWINPDDANNIEIDTEMSDTSANPVENRVIKAYVDSRPGGGGSTYTAGANITIENDVISATIPEEYVTDDELNAKGYLTAVPEEYAKKTELPTKTSQLANDSGYLTTIPENYVTDEELEAKGYLTEYNETDPMFSASASASITSQDIANWNNKQNSLVVGANITIENNVISATDTTYEEATTTTAGLMSATDKTKVDVITTDGDGNSYLANDGTYKEVSSGGGGATYTAGTNIEITADNVINNTIPCVIKNLGGGGNSGIGLGDKVSVATYASVAIGGGCYSNTFAVAIGANALSEQDNVAIGYNAKAPNANGFAIAIGAYAKVDRKHIGSIAIGTGSTNVSGATVSNTTKSNQVMFGSGENGINEVAMRTTDGNVKTLATTDLVTALADRVTALETQLANLTGTTE